MKHATIYHSMLYYKYSSDRTPLLCIVTPKYFQFSGHIAGDVYMWYFVVRTTRLRVWQLNTIQTINYSQIMQILIAFYWHIVVFYSQLY